MNEELFIAHQKKQLGYLSALAYIIRPSSDRISPSDDKQANNQDISLSDIFWETDQRPLLGSSSESLNPDSKGYTCAKNSMSQKEMSNRGTACPSKHPSYSMIDKLALDQTRCTCFIDCNGNETILSQNLLGNLIEIYYGITSKPNQERDSNLTAFNRAEEFMNRLRAKEELKQRKRTNSTFRQRIMSTKYKTLKLRTSTLQLRI